MPRKKPVTQRKSGLIDIGGTRFPLSKSMSLEYVQAVYRLVFEEDSFFIVLYGALNVGGLIGTERNGIAVLWESQGKVILESHFQDSSYMQASDRQRREYAVICNMDKSQFKAFINEHPGAKFQIMVPKPEPILRPRLKDATNTIRATWQSARTDKTTFFAALIRFLCDHCDPDKFTRKIYDGLHHHLGHIAHYDRGGFYSAWFANAKSRVEFLEHHATYTTHGDWADVGAALMKWIKSPEGQTVLAHYQAEAAKVVAFNREEAQRG